MDGKAISLPAFMNPKVKELYNRLLKGVENVFTSGRLEEFLRFQARFHRYSFGNTLLIYTQKPDATYVAGYKTWQKLGRYVKKGEHGIMIFAPCQKKVLVKNDETGEETEEVHLAGFRVAYVFDISQTEGKPVPEFAKSIQSDTPAGEELYAVLLTVSPVPVEIGKLPGKAKGCYNPVTRRITIADWVTGDHRAKVLLHEIAHALAETALPKDEADRIRGELIAEGAAFIAASHFGIDAGEYSFDYLASWAGKPENMLKWGNEMQRVACRLIEMVEKARGQTTPQATLEELEEAA